jgi:hypothetical protein
VRYLRDPLRLDEQTAFPLLKIPVGAFLFAKLMRFPSQVIKPTMLDGGIEIHTSATNKRSRYYEERVDYENGLES